MIHFTKGDMFDLSVDLRVNTVNCLGVMGAGVALAFKKRYPDMFLEYRSACEAGEIRPGKMHVWRSNAGDWIVNFPTKRHWREKSRYEDIQSGLIAFRDYLKSFRGVRVALPALGCGNGGLDWSRVAPMISEHLNDVDAEIFVFEPADSIKIARRKSSPSPDQIMQELETLGFNSFELGEGLAADLSLRAKVKGNAELLVSTWIAVCTSRDVGPREFSALASIASQMGLSENPPTVALIYQSTGTEEIAEVFLKNGLAVVLILPFGPLVKKRIGLSNDQANRITYAILSVAESVEVKSIQLERFALDVLYRGANAILLSDPDPKRYLKDLRKSGINRAGFFIRYAAHTNDMVNQLEQDGFRSIGRRAGTGEPNLNPLLGESNSTMLNGDEEIANGTQITALVSAEQLRGLATLIEDSNLHQGTVNISFSFESIPKELHEALRAILYRNLEKSADTHTRP